MRLSDLFPKSEKNKAMAVVCVVVLTLAAAFFHEGIMLHSNTIEQIILTREQAINAVISDISRYSLTPYQERLATLVATHNGIPQTLHDRDRAGLYGLVLPLYQALQRENKHLYVMHFHLPDGRSFLRMHNPEKFGDDLRHIRPAVQKVHADKTPLNCYEIGIYGAFYRIIQPIFYQGAYVGAVELGIKVHAIMESIQERISDPLTTFYLTEKWQKVIKAAVPEHQFLTFGKYTLNTHDEPLYNALPRNLELSRDNQRLTIAETSYLIHTLPIFTDHQGATLGGIVVMQDISHALAARQEYIVRSLIFSGSLLALALLVLYLSFGKLIGKLEQSRASLKKTVARLTREIDERKLTENELTKSKKEWERTFNAIGDIVSIMDSGLRIIKANQAAHTVLAAEPGTLAGKFCYEVFNNRSEACENCPGIATIDNCQVHSAEIYHENLGKKFLITTSPVPDERGEFSHIVHIAKDITEQRELENRLRQSQKMEAIGTLAGGIAHDFNNILTAISGYTQLALLKVDDKEKVIKDLHQVKNAAQRAKDLIKQILTFSRQTDKDQRSIHITHLVRETVKLLRSSIPSSIELRQDISTPGNILADPGQIQQIIMNLATNAYQAMLETGGILGIFLNEVTISDKEIIAEPRIKPGKYIRLEVSDTGCGMNAETKAKIFEPYFTTKEMGKGTGLGLAVVHGIVTAHHGYITVYSEPGHGTTFHVYLPMVEEEPVAAPPQSPQVIRGGTEHLLLVEDEESISELVTEVLQTYGYHVTSFADGKQAWHHFVDHPADYDLILTDMSMPHLTGLQLSEKVREVRPDIPIILCSGYGEMVFKDKARNAGINRYIQKPLELEDLARIIRETLDNSMENRAPAGPA